jgi:hypothetical protein
MFNIGRLIGAAALAVLVTFGSARMTNAASMPYHEPGLTQCFGSTVRAFAPMKLVSASGGSVAKNVSWSPDLYRWNSASQTWNLVNSTAGWLNGAANGSGLLALESITYQKWINASGGLQNQWNYNNLAHGYYAVRDYYRWSDEGVKGNDWGQVYNGAATGYCQI